MIEMEANKCTSEWTHPVVLQLSESMQNLQLPPPLPQDDLPSLLLSISEEIKTLNLRVKSIEDRLPSHVHVPSRVPSREEEEDEGEEEDEAIVTGM